ncbi:c-type cytochrome [Aliiroseovarius crassostreae]|uniref:c-type cytochrome n=1 Tax=Aliiroseovarius crassostreae TaxID=154981 RepID=UPI0021FACAEC|nr:cytochrome c [Aliiroseovarius crassostreae]UWP98608.1 cytochrome c [Aliiroseovarius crassostreae]
MKTENLIKGALVASVLAMAGQTVFAHGGATGVVKERMDGMSVMKDAMKVLTPMMRGEAEYDATVVRARAEDVSRHAGEALTRLFPEGSTDKASEAKPEIWQDWESFSGLADQLRLAADGLAAASENGLMMAGDMPAAGSMMSGQNGTMMGGGMMAGQGGAMMGGMMGSGSDGAMMDLSQMPADGVFAMMGQVCAACHTRFRVEK